MTPALWLTYGVLAFMGLVALAIIRRLAEAHHLYIGMALALIPWPPARYAGLVLMADDAVQHAVEAIEYFRGYILPDWSPIHRLYVLLYRLIARTADS
ncbi:MAG TPA: hypothetical protein VN607_09305 [Gemmatimonadaceae bacterium]|nr:hypothetical protein [Gemmatimonadaceae bacterium]